MYDDARGKIEPENRKTLICHVAFSWTRERVRERNAISSSSSSSSLMEKRRITRARFPEILSPQHETHAGRMVIRLSPPPFHGAVTDIQEFYELTLLDESKSVQQKTAETIRIADKWEASDGPITPTFAQNDVSIPILPHGRRPRFSSSARNRRRARRPRTNLHARGAASRHCYSTQRGQRERARARAVGKINACFQRLIRRWRRTLITRRAAVPRRRVISVANYDRRVDWHAPGNARIQSIGELADFNC